MLLKHIPIKIPFYQNKKTIHLLHFDLYVCGCAKSSIHFYSLHNFTNTIIVSSSSFEDIYVIRQFDVEYAWIFLQVT